MQIKLQCLHAEERGILSMIVLYVDDLLITSRSALNKVDLLALNKAFAMIDLGQLRQFIGLKVSQNNLGIMISQSK